GDGGVGGGRRTGDQGAAERLSRSSERRVQRSADLAENGQESQRQTRGNDAVFERAVMGVVFRGKLVCPFHFGPPSHPWAWARLRKRDYARGSPLIGA